MVDHRQVQTERGLLLLNFRGKLGRAILNKSSLEKDKNSRLWLLLIGCKQWLVCCCLGQGGIFLPFLKEWEMKFLCEIWPHLYQQKSNILIIRNKKLRLREFYTKNSIQTDLLKIILIFLLPAGFAGCNKWYVHENFPFRASNSFFFF